jgi:hypothetical protein
MNYWSEFFRALLENFKPKLELSHIGEDITRAIMPKTLGAVDVFGYKPLISDATVASWGCNAAAAGARQLPRHKPAADSETKRQAAG